MFTPKSVALKFFHLLTSTIYVACVVGMSRFLLLVLLFINKLIHKKCKVYTTQSSVILAITLPYFINTHIFQTSFQDFC